MREPSVPKELLDYLSSVFQAPKIYPGTPADPFNPDKAMFDAGSRRVVTHLQSLYERQQEENNHVPEFL